MELMGPFVLAAGSLVVAIVTVVTTAFDRRRQARSADRDRRLEMVREVIRRLETVARKQARPIYGRLWANPAQEFALASANLTLLITEDEEPLVLWLNHQVRRMQAAPSDRAATVIAVHAASELASWLRGARPVSWFQEHPDTEKAPRKSWLRPFSNGIELVWASLLLGASAAGVLACASWLEEKLSGRRGGRGRRAGK